MPDRSKSTAVRVIKLHDEETEEVQLRRKTCRGDSESFSTGSVKIHVPDRSKSTAERVIKLINVITVDV